MAIAGPSFTSDPDRVRPQIGNLGAFREDGDIDRDFSDLAPEVLERAPLERISVEVGIGAVVDDRHLQLLGAIRSLHQKRDVQERLGAESSKPATDDGLGISFDVIGEA